MFGVLTMSDLSALGLECL